MKLLLPNFKGTICLSTFATLLLLLGYSLGYWSGFSRAQRGRAIIGPDKTEITSFFGQAPVFDPDSSLQNAIPDKMK